MMDLPQTLGICDALQRFNGLGNVLAYALNSMLARGTVFAPEVSGDCVSADNEFEQWAGVQNVRVAFNVGEHEEHMVRECSASLYAGARVRLPLWNRPVQVPLIVKRDGHVSTASKPSLSFGVVYR